MKPAQLLNKVEREIAQLLSTAPWLRRLEAVGSYRQSMSMPPTVAEGKPDAGATSIQWFGGSAQMGPLHWKDAVKPRNCSWSSCIKTRQHLHAFHGLGGALQAGGLQGRCVTSVTDCRGNVVESDPCLQSTFTLSLQFALDSRATGPKCLGRGVASRAAVFQLSCTPLPATKFV